MNITRRGFLKVLGIGIGMGVAPLVIKDGIARGILMPVRGIVMPTEEELAWLRGPLLTPRMITKEALRIIHRNCVLTNDIQREIIRSNSQSADTIKIRLPTPFQRRLDERTLGVV